MSIYLNIGTPFPPPLYSRVESEVWVWKVVEEEIWKMTLFKELVNT